MKTSDYVILLGIFLLAESFYQIGLFFTLNIEDIMHPEWYYIWATDDIFWLFWWILLPIFFLVIGGLLKRKERD